jgi:hypothetical protein
MDIVYFNLTVNYTDGRLTGFYGARPLLVSPWYIFIDIFYLNLFIWNYLY